MSLGPACAGKPTLEATAPPATGEEPGFLSTIDLPPAGRVQNPWVGVPSVNALGKVDRTTRCDRANFRRAGATKARSRTWLVPEDKDLPQTFGLTQTFGKFRTEKAAKRFLQRVRASVAGCEDRELTLEVHDIYSRNSERDQVSAWKFENKVSDKVTVPIRVGFARSGNWWPRWCSSRQRAPTSADQAFSSYCIAQPTGCASCNVRRVNRYARTAAALPTAPRSGRPHAKPAGQRPATDPEGGRQPAVRISRINAAVSDGVLPTFTPTASRASFLAWAVPEEPDTIAPA